jgi:hypothetical protein
MSSENFAKAKIGFSAITGLWFWCGCGSCASSAYELRNLRHLERHIYPALRKSNQKVFVHYMRRVEKDLINSILLQVQLERKLHGACIDIGLVCAAIMGGFGWFSRRLFLRGALQDCSDHLAATQSLNNCSTGRRKAPTRQSILAIGTQIGLVLREFRRLWSTSRVCSHKNRLGTVPIKARHGSTAAPGVRTAQPRSSAIYLLL